MMKDQIKLFIDIAEKFHASCMTTKDKFKISTHHELYEKLEADGKYVNVKMYIGTDHDTWSFSCYHFEYSNYSNKFVMRVHSKDIDQMERDLIYINNFLLSFLSKFQNRIAKKRKLIFKNNNHE